jgi:hypothetical protein
LFAHPEIIGARRGERERLRRAEAGAELAPGAGRRGLAGYLVIERVNTLFAASNVNPLFVTLVTVSV